MCDSNITPFIIPQPGSSKIQVALILSAIQMNAQHGDRHLQKAANKVIAAFNDCREELSQFALNGTARDGKRSACKCEYQTVLRAFCAAYRVYESIHTAKTNLSEVLLTSEAKRVLRALADDQVLSLEDIVCFSPTLMVELPRMLVLSACLSSAEVIESMRFILSQEMGPGQRNSDAFRTIAIDLQLVNNRTYSRLQQGPAAICAESNSNKNSFEYDAEFRRLWLRVCALGHCVLQGTTTSAWGRIFSAACSSFDMGSTSSFDIDAISVLSA
ncbi:hypothetical protein SARC_08175 [Sphaeroforma arctica JP610]|uniref:Uncharacterized protein n=1 Tax=Sphaeroforma arctica JP610 TaxID=667725 RepID=A0A0L0FU31_9EUKA|nr:hypothetical protein SARC_08175 [Sphaeroforma arctica JP610]KNC79433.1 hypothetical protein SARC_08175 [Sphaeroforma arctica JP610]|eukprot:XP_014153335.1 hypothetical protein SARC_08175 [Sphaeroforma arctica JP610]